MAYRLGEGETTSEALRRCAREELDDAIGQLSDKADADHVEAVHNARKSLKKERALLRLARGSLRPQDRRRENVVFRDAARRLSTTRDADVMIQALDGLADRYAGQFPSTSVDAIRERLEGQRQVARLELMASGATALVIEELKAARSRIDEWRFRRDGWKAIGVGLSRSYGQGRKAFQRARKAPTVENLHEWRKRGKDLWYQLRLLEPTAPQTIGAHAKDAHELSDLLGDDHDLALLRETVGGVGAEIPVDSEAVLVVIDHRREQLQREALFLACRLYAESPKAFLRRVHRYWKAWRAQTDAASSSRPADLAEATRRPAEA
jgi:CHAD domain-containing protein